ncbi:MAG: oxidoreductase [Chloroflexota bacterium]|nr:MAG: oxidoreductase [Chloroflexota bacterium]
MKNFQDRVVWLTGASSGIGEGAAYALAQQGAKLILSARRVEELERVKRNCAGASSRLAILPLDVADLPAAPEKAKQARALFGRIDILINNAGVGFRGYVKDTEIAVQQRVMQVNYFGSIALTKATLPYMIEQQSGQIVVISSLAGKLPIPGYSAYCASKHALHGFFDSLRAEVYQYGIKVTIICPGFVQTRISENALLPDGSVRGGARTKGHRSAMTIEASAKHILYAIRAEKQEYAYGGIEKFAVPIREFFPWLYARALRRMPPSF